MVTLLEGKVLLKEGKEGGIANAMIKYYYFPIL